MSFQNNKGALEYFYNSQLVRIEPWGKNALRVRANPEGKLTKENRALANKGRAKATITIDEELSTIVNGNVKATIDKNGKIVIYNKKGEALLSEKLRLQPLRTPARFFKPRLCGGYELTMSFEADPNEKIFGMGQYQHSFLNLKGCTLELAHRNSQASVPFYISSRGYGFLWNLPAIGEVSFSKNVTKWYASMTCELDYLVIVDSSVKKIEEAYMKIVGLPPMMPEYAMGLWQSKLRYRTDEELLTVARKYKELNIPLSVIVCDFFHWPHQGDFRFDYDYFKDPEKMTSELKEMGTELMVSVWPTVEFESENYKKMLEKGYLIRNDRGPSNHTEFVHPAVYYDTTNPGAQKFVWDLIKKNYYDKGIRLFWLDEAEPEYLLYDYDNHRYFAGNCAEVGNIYPVYYIKGFYDGLKEAGEKETICLIRCAWAGSAKYGALAWSGDIMPTFEALRDQIQAGLNMAIAGIPWWTTDIGGFDTGDPDNDEYRELIIRWFEYATFGPVLRMHGYRDPYIPAEEGATGAGQCFSGGNNEIWSYGKEAFEIMKDHVFLRERMKPYIKEQMEIASKQGTPPMRPLFYDFNNDKRAWDVEDEFMFGEGLLIAPIYRLGAREREVYLPGGTSWINAYTGEKIKGGKTIIANAPLSHIPVFIREEKAYLTELFKG